MQVLRLLAARRLRRAVSTISAPAASCEAPEPEHSEADGDEGPFFDLDFASVRASSTSSSGSEDSDDACSDFDFVISLHRSRSASPSYEALYLAPPPPPPPLKFCASEARAAQLQHGGAKRAGNALRTLSFGARKAAFYGGRPSFARSSSSARSLRLFMESPADDDDDEAAEPRRAPPSRDVIRRCLTKISRRFRSVRPRAAATAAEGRGLRRLRKSLSASAAVTVAASGSARRDDSLAEKQDGIASAIAHCKESLHRASLSECDSSLLRSQSDPGKCEAA
ncbi:hypothetical protein ACP70R_035921 [Stipagrostis hirtigluma subsp. patula]